jgi:Flp pilus assembly protein TadB
MIPVLFVGLGLFAEEKFRYPTAPLVVAGLWILHPGLGIGVAVVGGWLVLFRKAMLRRVTSTSPDDVVAFGELVSLAMSSGASPIAAVSAARKHGPESIAGEVGRILRRSSTGHAAAAFRGHTGALAPIIAPIGHALTTGAPLGLRVDVALTELRADVHARQVARLRRLPVRLLFPLTLLILPGFMVLTLGPSLLATLDRLQL